MIKIYYTDIKRLENDDVYAALCAALPPVFNLRVQRYKKRSSKNQSLAAYACLWSALCDASLCDRIDKISISPKGKPEFKNAGELYFNISHSEGCAVAALSDKPIGVDIQFKSDFKEAVCRHYFSAREAQWVFSQPNKKKDNFFRVWTLKEAYAKLTGEGLASFKDFEINLTSKPFVISGALFISPAFWELDLGDYYLAAACLADDDNVVFKNINILKLIIK